MATCELCRHTASVVFKTTAALVTTTSFLAAAVFLVAVLWLPADAASSNSEVDVRPALLLALDKPQTPAPKLRFASLEREVKEITDFASPDLVTELNSWTFTQGNLGQQFRSFITMQIGLITRQGLHTLYTDVSLLLNLFRFEAMILGDFGIPVPGFLTNAINLLSHFQNGLSQFR